MRAFPEVDGAAWFPLDLAAEKILKGQKPFLDRLAGLLQTRSGLGPAERRGSSSRDSINAIVPTMKFEGMCGPCDFSAPITPATQLGVGHPADHVVKHPAMGGQWVKASGGQFKYNFVSVDNSAAPAIAAVAGMVSDQHRH